MKSVINRAREAAALIKERYAAPREMRERSARAVRFFASRRNLETRAAIAAVVECRIDPKVAVAGAEGGARSTAFERAAEPGEFHVVVEEMDNAIPRNGGGRRSKRNRDGGSERRREEGGDAGNGAVRVNAIGHRN